MTTLFHTCSGINAKLLGSVVHILIDRPKHLNAINKDICATLRSIFSRSDIPVAAFLIRGMGNRAFCSGFTHFFMFIIPFKFQIGGDVKELHTAVMNNSDKPFGQPGISCTDFYHELYNLVSEMHKSSIPIVIFCIYDK